MMLELATFFGFCSELVKFPAPKTYSPQTPVPHTVGQQKKIW